MQKLLQHIYIIPLFVSMLLSLKVFRLSWPAQYKNFSILLIIIVVTELFAISWKYYFHNNLGNLAYTSSNLWLYNIALIPQYLLYLRVYYLIIQSPFQKKLIRILGILFPAFAIINLFFIQSIHTVNSYTIVVASGIILFLTVCYFDQLRNANESIKLTGHPMVWLSLGAFIFHAANLPYIISLDYLIHKNLSLAIALYYIYLGLNCILYTFYSIAFLCPKPLLKY